MPKANDYPATLIFRVSSDSKSDLLTINKVYSDTAREAIEQYIPIKKLLVNPLAIKRSILSESGDMIEFALSQPEDKLNININGQSIDVSSEDIRHILANIFSFTLNKSEV